MVCAVKDIFQFELRAWNVQNLFMAYAQIQRACDSIEV